MKLNLICKPLLAFLLVAALPMMTYAEEWIDTDDDGEVDTLQLDPFVVNGNDPETFDWEGFWDYLDSLEFDFLTDQTEDIFFDDSGYTGGGSFSTWESQQTSETYRGIALKGSQSDINQVKTWIDNIANHANQTVAAEFHRLIDLANTNNISPVWRLGTGTLTIGNFENSALDVADISKFPTATGFGATQGSVFAHELFEQLYKQVEGKAFNDGPSDAHPLAVAIENELSGMLRGDVTPSVHLDGSRDVTTRFTTEDGTLVVDQTQHFDADSNLTSVTSVTVTGPG